MSSLSRGVVGFGFRLGWSGWNFNGMAWWSGLAWMEWLGCKEQYLVWSGLGCKEWSSMVLQWWFNGSSVVDRSFASLLQLQPQLQSNTLTATCSSLLCLMTSLFSSLLSDFLLPLPSSLLMLPHLTTALNLTMHYTFALPISRISCLTTLLTTCNTSAMSRVSLNCSSLGHARSALQVCYDSCATCVACLMRYALQFRYR
jgi:hypothetical protein